MKCSHCESEAVVQQVFSVTRKTSVKENSVTTSREDPVGLVRLGLCQAHICKGQERIVRQKLMLGIGSMAGACLAGFCGLYLYFDRQNNLEAALLPWGGGLVVLLLCIFFFRDWNEENRKLKKAQQTGDYSALAHDPIAHVADTLFSGGLKTVTDVIWNYQGFERLMASGVPFAKALVDPASFAPLKLDTLDSFYWNEGPFIYALETTAQRTVSSHSLVNPAWPLWSALNPVPNHNQQPPSEASLSGARDKAVAAVTNELYMMCAKALLGSKSLEESKDAIRGIMEKLSRQQGNLATNQVMENLQKKYPTLAGTIAQLIDDSHSESEAHL